MSNKKYEYKVGEMVEVINTENTDLTLGRKYEVVTVLSHTIFVRGYKGKPSILVTDQSGIYSGIPVECKPCIS